MNTDRREMKTPRRETKSGPRTHEEKKPRRDDPQTWSDDHTLPTVRGPATAADRETAHHEQRRAGDAPQRTQEHGPTPRQAQTLPTIHGSERAAERAGDQKPRNVPHTLTTHGRTHTEATGRTERAGPRQTIHRQHHDKVRSCRILEPLTRCRIYTYRGIPFLSCSR